MTFEELENELRLNHKKGVQKSYSLDIRTVKLVKYHADRLGVPQARFLKNLIDLWDKYVQDQDKDKEIEGN